MKTTLKITAVLLLFLFLGACGGGMQNKSKDDNNLSTDNTESYSEDLDDDAYYDEEGGYTESEAPEYNKDARSSTAQATEEVTKVISSSAASIGKIDSVKKLIRKADLKFRTNNVVNSTYALEELTKHFDGYVSYTHLESDVNRVEETKISEDSLIESTYYTVTNTMTIRVPVANLDTMLKSMVILIDFLDYRTITAEDVTFQIMSKELERKRLELYDLRVSKAAGNTYSNLDMQVNAAERQLEKQIRNDEAKIEMLKIFDDIEYATITLHMYGREKVKHVVLADEENIDAYKPGFGRKLGIALDKGLDFLANFLIVLVAIWPLYLFGIIAWVIYRIVKRRNRNKGE
ncbi:MAG: hypothetical protein C0592_07860 [Marinilabiliales bacterium]|nr:MAG: hypothetical protein C0592_07860 [Marinilabiliales bacterium]